MKNTKKYIKIKNKRTRKNKYTRKNKRKNAKMYHLKGGQKTCDKPPTQKAETYYCNQNKDSTKKTKCLDEVNKKYSEKEGECNPYTCCSDECNPELCEPWQDIVSNGIYPPVKWTYDKATGTLTWVVGGMFSYSATGIVSGMINTTLDTIKDKIPKVEDLNAYIEKIKIPGSYIEKIKLPGSPPGYIPGAIPGSPPGYIPGAIPINFPGSSVSAAAAGGSSRKKKTK